MRIADSFDVLALSLLESSNRIVSGCDFTSIDFACAILISRAL